MDETNTSAGAAVGSSIKRMWVRLLRTLSLRAYFGSMSSLPLGLREFVWLGMAFAYPGLALIVVAVLMAYTVLVTAAWLLFSPLRLFMRATHRGDYAPTERA